MLRNVAKQPSVSKDWLVYHAHESRKGMRKHMVGDQASL